MRDKTLAYIGYLYENENTETDVVQGCIASLTDATRSADELSAVAAEGVFGKVSSIVAAARETRLGNEDALGLFRSISAASQAQATAQRRQRRQRRLDETAVAEATPPALPPSRLTAACSTWATCCSKTCSRARTLWT